MKIDIITPSHLKQLEEHLRISLNNMHKDIQKIWDRLRQLEDRVQIIEGGNSGKSIWLS